MTRILVRADASPKVGGGHVTRCLALAGRLTARGARVKFVSAQLLPGMASRIRESGHETCTIEPSEIEPGEHWDAAPMADTAQREDCDRTLAAFGATAPHWIVVDHYRLGAAWHQRARVSGAKILVVDDLANRRHDCDLLLDQTFGRDAGDYRMLVPDGAQILAGAGFALLRPEFAAARADAFARHATGKPVERILLFLGTGNAGSITVALTKAIVAACVDCAIDVVLAPDVPSLELARDLAKRHPAIALHLDRPDMAELIANADLAVGAAGSTSWERCCLGLPTVMLVVAKNQRLIAANLLKAEACEVADDVVGAVAKVLALIGDPARREQLAAASMAIVDGLGSERVADRLLGDTADDVREPAIAIRAASDSDSRELWLWRNDPKTRAASLSAQPITWREHAAWWTSALRGRRIYVAEMKGRAGAMVRFDRIDDMGHLVHLVGINLSPTMRGRGLGARILSEACRVFRATGGDGDLEARIAQENVASRRIFETVGFQARPGEGRFQRFVLPASEQQTETLARQR